MNANPEPLTYYDRELQNAWNAEPFDPDRLRRAHEKSKQLYRAYNKQLRKLRPRLAKRTYERFTDEKDPLFDSNLLEFTFGDALGTAKKAIVRPSQAAVRATFLSFDEKTLHELRYRKLESLQVDLPTEPWFHWGGHKQIDSLLSHELTANGRSLMQHKFLFASGAVIAVTFAEMTWKTVGLAKKSLS
ncbi:MAG TPA: hypothetical protein VN577_14195 [Terriglobales bacterium]|nr:hypothetical protein [Terriglobales bacterium]